MASLEAMQAALDERLSLTLTHYEEGGSGDWWDKYRRQSYVLFPHVVTLPNARSFSSFILPPHLKAWLEENIGPEADLRADDHIQRGSPSIPNLGAWDWWYGSQNESTLDLERLDVIFLDPHDAISFKMRWA